MSLLISAAPAQALLPVPSAPVAPVASPYGTVGGETGLMVTWLAPLQFSDSVNVYQLQYSTDQGVIWTSTPNVPAVVTSYAISGLKAGDSYVVRVRSVSSTGSASAWAIAAPKLNKFVQISSGGSTTCGLLRSGEVMCWGANASGTAGDGTLIDRYKPVYVQGLSNIKSISVGSSHACAVTADGYVWCWGENGFGQLGDGTKATSSVPRVVSGVANVVAVAAGLSHTCALDADGLVYCWGRNAEGQLGTGNLTDVLTPGLPIAGLSSVTALSAGNAHTCAVLSDKTAKCWGDNTYGQLGDGTLNRRTLPVVVANLSQTHSIDVGSYSSCALLENSTVRCWGANAAGQLGDGTNTGRTSATAVLDISTATSISVGDGFACARLANSTVGCWGYNVGGQLGDGTSDNANRPVAVANLTIATDVSSGGVHACAILVDQTLSCWGSNTSGQAGVGYRGLDRIAPSTVRPAGVVSLTTGYNVSGRYSHTCALLGDARVACWGNNISGEAGDGTVQSPALPAVVPGLIDVVSVAAGADHTCAVKADGTVWCWGSNAAGQLGTGDLLDSTLPVQSRLFVAPNSSIEITDAAEVSAHGNNTCIVRTNGQVACWGPNSRGQIGRDPALAADTIVADPVTRTNVSVYWTGRGIPGFSGSGDLANVQQVAVGNSFVCVLLDDTTVWCWGANEVGQLGSGCVVAVAGNCDSYFPVDQGSLVTGTSLAVGEAHGCLANAETGSVFCWGSNSNGQIGNNDVAVVRAPVSVPTAVANIGAPQSPPSQTVVEVAAGADHSCAVMLDNSLQCWGSNFAGQLNRNRISVPRSLVPVSMVGMGQGQLVTAGTYHTCALSTAGTFQCWGYQGTDPLATPIGQVPLTDTVGRGAFGNATINSSPIGLGAVPSTPLDVQGSADNGQVLVSWVPSNARGALITRYVAVASPSGLSCSTTGANQCIVAGLTNGQAYTFTVTATNSFGDSLASAPSVAVTPLGFPTPPTNVIAVPGDSNVQVSWNLPLSDGGLAIEAYDVYTYINGELQDGVGCSTTTTRTCLVSALTNGTSYTFTVRATNSIGQSLESVASAAAVPSGLPSAVTSVHVARTSTTATVTWAAQNSNGAPVVTYTVTASNGGGTCVNTVGVSDPNTCTFTGLTPGVAYVFSVVATNNNGSSSAVSVGTAPVLAVTMGNAVADLSWSESTGGSSAATSYTVTAMPGNHQCSTLVTSPAPTACSISGLTNGQAYTFTVVATDGQGNTSGSVPAQGTPTGPPSRVSGVVVTRSGDSANITWTAANTNGSPISLYTVTAAPGVGKLCTSITTTCTISGLSLTAAYTFSVRATNDIGDAQAVVVAAPSSLSAVRGDGQVTLTWDGATGGDAAVATYTVQSSVQGKSCSVTAGDPNTCTISGLTNGTIHTFTVTATDVNGHSASAVPVTATPAGAPLAVAQPTAVFKDQAAAVSWTAPSNNGAAITSYRASVSGDNTKFCETSTTSCDISGLTNNQSYTFVVTATNVIGTSAPSVQSAAVIPAGLPIAPTNVVAVAGDQKVTLSWAAAGTNGRAITGYTVTSNVNGVTCSVGGDVLGCEITGLTNGKSYTFTVRATNVVGGSLASVASDAAIPAGAPFAPTNVVGVGADRKVTVSWTPANNNGRAVTSYTVTSSPEGKTCQSSTTSCDVTGLSNGLDYTFTVRATNVIGQSVTSAPSLASMPAGVPFAPTNLAAVAGDTKVTLSWAAAEGNGRPVTGYVVTSGVAGVGCSVGAAELGCVVTGAKNGITYTFQVAAVNIVGQSNRASVAAKPFGKPTAVTSVRVSGVASKILNLGLKGASSNGSALTGYLVRWALGTSTKYTAWKPVKINGLFGVSVWKKSSTIKVQAIAINAVGQTVSKVFTLNTPK